MANALASVDVTAHPQLRLSPATANRRYQPSTADLDLERRIKACGTQLQQSMEGPSCYDSRDLFNEMKALINQRSEAFIAHLERTRGLGRS
jgi:hypothetical protein